MRLDDYDGEEDDDSQADSDVEAEWPAGGQEEDDFPPEEEDDENPDWYRTIDLGDLSEGEGVGETDQSADIDDATWNAELEEDEDPEDERQPGVVPPSDISIHFDDHGYYAYVLARRSPMPFGAAEASHLRQALLASGIVVSRSGASYQPASDGAQYDWFLRVRTESGEKPQSSAVWRALSGFVRDTSAPSANEHVRQLERRVAQADAALATADERIVVALREAAAARAAECEVRNSLEHLRAQAERTRLSAIETEALLVERLAAAVAARRTDRPADAESLLAQVKDALADQRAVAEELRLVSARKSEELESFMTAFDAENTRLRADLENALAEVSRLRTTPSAPARSIAPTASKAGLKELFDALLPHVRFHGPSFDILHKELPDPIPAIALIGEVQVRGSHRKEKVVVSAHPWRRVHFRTGTTDDGRLYFAKNRSSAHLEILVSRKGQQHEDIHFLRSIPLS